MRQGNKSFLECCYYLKRKSANGVSEKRDDTQNGNNAKNLSMRESLDKKQDDGQGKAPSYNRMSHSGVSSNEIALLSHKLARYWQYSYRLSLNYLAGWLPTTA